MACQGGPTAEQAEQQRRAVEQRAREERELRALVPKLREAERQLGILLCEACGLLEGASLLPKASAKLRAWFKAHKAEDERGKVAAGALAKLSKKEREALGLDKIAGSVKGRKR